ncbi:hypothetical protein A2833_01575 [Candidatus Azambacteria bacterium RIFCSPHIGHO2_01_FULL_44_55]|uniref:Lysine--tRNA ligase n=1 Tax=Candidatus Azambacteria bacterium RIFCSPLOWO2_02_FULL_44_14 TaxID=1797306 RepID=A0A1F5CBM5_9BACT|nr:MAG: hypothetical protein A3C78_03035 [Candidatus Azambacteria bacterium RIFCSPHIGHO2_02_FULL_45_18]OGD40311.1 MAG: hypothetical protein A3I30_03395 [Candidatus Azambacteria bacterium RIFCSPLOWO2_02_FULL_44_14]OGD40739.1 MAG: hypothetical protein A2833_01575 [Candidatus Azambacteria bacterium RIFCSPHIGHO2_01_FULL_44_55]OGD50402.1 MAG: hypothetical protein A2608_03560 [Candidatus Azambacteria bacterium RIFOXYD1_FULL_44_10]
MTSLEELRETRIKKLQALEKAGLVAYPAKISRAQTVGEILEKFLLFWITKKSVLTAGRIKTLRTHGGITFADLEDFSGRIQLLFSKEALEKTAYQNLLDYFDIGDFIEVSGTVLKTKLGEKTIKAQRFAMAAKTLRPLPEKWHGLQDVEERFRRRYLDLLMNPETKKKLLNRSVITKAIRDYLDGGGFLEVETPILQNLAGGAAAKPFKTHLNTLDLELYLRVAPELYLKRMLIGGWEKIYEIGKNFRNEGIDASHNPEFTMLEAYIAYENSEYLKTFIKNLLQTVVKKINNGNATVRYEDKEIDFSGDWKETDYSDLVKKFEDQARPDEGVTAWDIAKKTLIQPTVVSGFPKNILPLARATGEKADAFQIIIGGWELIKAFSELNNPLEQKTRFEEQEKLRQTGDHEAQHLDEDFIEALEYGMPPAAGFGLGIDRLAALLTDSHSLREIILFPTMRPKI